MKATISMTLSIDGREFVGGVEFSDHIEKYNSGEWDRRKLTNVISEWARKLGVSGIRTMFNQEILVDREV